MPPQPGLASKSDEIMEGLYDRMLGRTREDKLLGIDPMAGAGSMGPMPAGLNPVAAPPGGPGAPVDPAAGLNPVAPTDPMAQQQMATDAQASDKKRRETATAVDFVKLGNLVNNEQYGKASDQLGEMMFSLGEQAGGNESGYAGLMPLYKLFQDADYEGVQKVIAGTLTAAVQNGVLDGSLDSVQKVASAGVPGGDSKKDYDELIMWGNVIAGVGAGLQGRGGEFLLNLRKRKAADEKARLDLMKERRELSKFNLGGDKKSYAPITLVNPETGEKQLFSPIVSESGEATLSAFDIPEGFEVSRETAEEQRLADAIAKQGIAITKRDNGLIQVGLDASDTLPTLNRSLELLDLVKTGGFEGVKQNIYQYLGIQSGDEAETSTLMLRNVLAQLRPTFGSQFTEREGARLERIEAGIGKSTEGNRRILKQLITMTERSANRAIKLAEGVGDYNGAQMIRDSMAFRMTNPDKKDTKDMTDDELRALASGG